MKVELIAPTIGIATLVALFVIVSVGLALLVGRHVEKRFDFEDDE